MAFFNFLKIISHSDFSHRDANLFKKWSECDLVHIYTFKSKVKSEVVMNSSQSLCRDEKKKPSWMMDWKWASFLLVSWKSWHLGGFSPSWQRWLVAVVTCLPHRAERAAWECFSSQTRLAASPHTFPSAPGARRWGQRIMEEGRWRWWAL